MRHPGSLFAGIQVACAAERSDRLLVRFAGCESHPEPFVRHGTCRLISCGRKKKLLGRFKVLPAEGVHSLLYVLFRPLDTGVGGGKRKC